MIKGVHFYGSNKKFSMDVIARYTKSNDLEKIENGYDYAAKIFLRKPYTPIKAVQLRAGRNRRENAGRTNGQS